ncbi:MAG TPA: xanthine dehydrogenase family protein molybdopterin-binding subunit [Acidimicrobiales bacterium]|nr:xanthine dehydrogenase family protein molybdopterin-binding subunit [Acidimicrobiales bacterium]
MSDTNTSRSILGNRVLRKEDPKFLTTGGVYVDDVHMELVGAAAVTYVGSTMASARILAIGTDEAKAAPGVLGVFTAADVQADLGDFPSDMGVLNQDMVRPWLATDVVRYVGEPVVIIVSDTRTQGVDAAELVLVEYDPLPVVVDPEEAVTNEHLLHESAGTNISFEIPPRKPADFETCEVVIRQRIVNQRVAPCPLEVRAAAALWTDEGRLTHWASTQGPHSVRDALAKVYGLDKAQVRVISPDVGGGFGAKGATYPEELLMGWLARKVGRPVKWVETRSESMLNLGHGRGQVQDVELGGSRDGTIRAYRVHVLQDSGAYPRMGAVLPFMTRTMLTGVYAIPDAEFRSTSVVTNTTPTVAYRGAGRPEAAAAIERAVDLFATEIGMDPAEVRRKNFIANDAFPYKTRMGTTYDSGNYGGALDLALEAAGYEELRGEQERRRENGSTKVLGIGMSVYVEITGGGPSEEYGAIEIRPDGTVLAKTGTSPHGQGHVTSWAMLISDRTGIPIDKIDVVHGDTDVVPQGGMTGGSRSLQVGGVAMHQAAGEMVEQAKQLAAELLEANPDDVVLDRTAGRFHVTGTPAVAKDWSDLATAASADGGAGLVVEHVFNSTGATFPSGSHVAVVEVDTDTGKVELVRMVAVDDAGRILNPLIAEGQVHGGLAQGAAQALLEEMAYDPDGNPMTGNFADYGFVSADVLPTFEIVHLETPTPLNELGAKGIGESGTIGATPAVQNAVIDALAHLGVRHIDMPCTAEKVWRAIQEAGA